MERVVYVDNCMVCGVHMNDFKCELSIVTSFSHKPIYQLIEEFTSTNFSDELLSETGVCQSCFIKFNEYDELTTKAESIQRELITLFDSNLNAEQSNEEIIKEETDDVVIYEVDDSKQHEEIVENDETIETIEDEDQEIDLVEVDFLEANKLPREYQSSDDQKLVKTRSIKSESDEGLTILQLENNVKLFQCDICFRTFKEKSKLKSHRLIHTSERNIVCPTCGKTFKTQACLRSHKRVHNPTIIECDYCGKKYTQKPELMKHINFVHFNRRDYICEICTAGFGCKGHLKAHYLTHEQHRGIACEICGFSFHTRAKLQRHMRSHTGQRDYECGICHKRFLYSYNVSAHIRHVHWKEKRKVDESTKKCNFCSKKFQKVWKLREHLQIEHQFIESEIIEESEIIDDSNVDFQEMVEA